MEKDKTEIKVLVETDFLAWDEDGPIKQPMYFVRFTKFYPYKDRDNYLCHREETDYLQSDSIDKLYEQMGKLVVDFMIYAEKQNSWNSPRDEFTIEFSNIYIEVESYNQERMKNSEEYKNIGAAKERARIKELEEKAKEEKRRQEWVAAEREKRDREEFERLSKKYSKK